MELLDELEQQITNMIQRYEQLSKENEILKQQQKELSSQTAHLSEKHHKVYSRVESMLKQLKLLEQQ